MHNISGMPQQPVSYAGQAPMHAIPVSYAPPGQIAYGQPHGIQSPLSAQQFVNGYSLGNGSLPPFASSQALPAMTIAQPPQVMHAIPVQTYGAAAFNGGNGTLAAQHLSATPYGPPVPVAISLPPPVQGQYFGASGRPLHQLHQFQTPVMLQSPYAPHVDAARSMFQQYSSQFMAGMPTLAQYQQGLAAFGHPAAQQNSASPMAAAPLHTMPSSTPLQQQPVADRRPPQQVSTPGDREHFSNFTQPMAQQNAAATLPSAPPYALPLDATSPQQPMSHWQQPQDSRLPQAAPPPYAPLHSASLQRSPMSDWQQPQKPVTSRSAESYEPSLSASSQPMNPTALPHSFGNSAFSQTSAPLEASSNSATDAAPHTYPKAQQNGSAQTFVPLGAQAPAANPAASAPGNDAATAQANQYAQMQQNMLIQQGMQMQSQQMQNHQSAFNTGLQNTQQLAQSRLDSSSKAIESNKW